MLRDLEEAGKGASTRRVARIVLRRALALAQECGLVQRNVATLVKAPPASTKTDYALDLDGVKQLIAAAEGDRLEALYVIAVMVGLRKGECLALTWGDVDLGLRLVDDEADRLASLADPGRVNNVRGQHN
jgi:integrase